MRALLACFALGYLVVSACSSPGGVARTKAGSGSGGSAGSGGMGYINPNGGGINCDPSAPGSPCSPDAPAPPGCGDGILTEDEACDDANKADGDGCWANCLGVDPGYSCNPPGVACHEIARCGDGVLSLSEPCDDGNVAPGDGCSDHCKLEIGFKCEGSPSVCSATTCGDGVLEGAESCEDGNTLPFDGCSATCQAEPDCSAGACTSECGDGLVLGEDCDDGNRNDGDGCSSTCTVEAGFTCEQDVAACEMINGSCVLRVPVIYRDFQESHADFQVDCKGMMNGEVATPGLVQTTLVDGKPAPTAAAAASCVTALGEWYTDTVATPVGSDIVLFDDGNGGYVNRYGANGEQWASRPMYDVRWCGKEAQACTASPGAPDYFDGCGFDPATEQCWSPCTVPGGCNGDCSCAGTVTVDAYYDGTPVFFPVDDQMTVGARYDAKIPPQYGYTWPFEDQVVPVLDAPHVDGAAAHNFHFTTEVNYWFLYDAGTSAALNFTGDDDVWVFVNNTLAVDLGGVHQPVDGSMTIDSTTAATYGLEDGNVYKITVFHAERKTESSSFRLTLAGFSTARSDCSPVCGDGIVGLGEQCDDGLNDGGYGECEPGCVLGAYCGDGIVQGDEDCDDGNRIDGDACGSACRVIVVK